MASRRIFHRSITRLPEGRFDRGCWDSLRPIAAFRLLRLSSPKRSCGNVDPTGRHSVSRGARALTDRMIEYAFFFGDPQSDGCTTPAPFGYQARLHGIFRNRQPLRSNRIGTRRLHTRYVICGVKISARWYFVDLALIARLNAADVTHDLCGQQADVELGSAAYPYCGAAHTEEYSAPPAPPVS
jgi:hypothetical protein